MYSHLLDSFVGCPLAYLHGPQQPHSWRLGGTSSAASEAHRLLTAGSRQFQSSGSSRRLRGARATATAELAGSQHYASSSKVLKEFLQYGVCREQYFTEVSLRGQLAAEARLFTETLAQQSRREELGAETKAIQLSVLEAAENACAARGQPNVAQTSVEASAAVCCVTKGAAESEAADLSVRAAQRAEHLHPMQDTEDAAQPKTIEERRESRRCKWQQYACAGVAVGVEAGAVELAARRRLQAERRGSPHLAGTSGQDAVPLARRRRASEEVDSALDIMLGQQGHILKRHEELQLIRDMQEGLAVHSAIEALQTEHSRPPSAQQLTERLGLPLEVISERLTRGLRAKHALLHANKRLVYKLAHRFGFDRRVPFEEYVVAGMDGLVRGLLKFDPCRGHKLSSLLVWWIRASVSSLATALNTIVHVPKKVQYALHALGQARRRLDTELCRPPTESELCAATRLDVPELRRLLALERRRFVSPDEPMTLSDGSARAARAWVGSETESDFSYEQLLQAPEDDTPLGALRDLGLRDFLEGELNGLPPREAAIVRSLYGLAGGPGPRSARLQKQVAAEFGVTPKRISQIRSDALRRLRAGQAELLQQALVSAPL